jgi:hypothetical protein
MVKRKLYVDKGPTRTVYLQDKSTGQLEGRRLIKKNERQDKILNLREEGTGRIFGFLPEGRKTIPVKGSNERRGYTRHF